MRLQSRIRSGKPGFLCECLSYVLVTNPMSTDYYRPQRSCGKVMFLHLSVSNSVHCHPPGRHTPWADTPQAATPGQTPPLGRHTPPTPCPVHAGIHTHPCTVHAGIQSTSGRYASYWNAYLLVLIFLLSNTITFCFRFSINNYKQE